jgi:hypothetical protein
VPTIGVFGLDNKYSLLSGPSLEAVIETCDGQLSRPSRTYLRGARPDTDADSFTMAIGTREELGISTPVRWRVETPPNRQRFCYSQASGRYHRARLRIPAGDPWTYARSVEPDGTPEGAL